MEPRPVRDRMPLWRLLPNLVTVAAICAGLTAIRFAALGQYHLSVVLILVAAVLDAVDGRLARMLRSESEIGAELDSLADFVNFGVAPGLTLYFWSQAEARPLLWAVVLVFAIACVLRLARFNVGARRPREERDDSLFVGVPAPAGATLALAPVFLAAAWPAGPRPVILVEAYLLLVAFLMISRVPTPSTKAMRIRAEHAKYVLVGFVALLALVVSFPWVTLLLLCAVYLGVVAWSAVRRSRRA
ncbi:phosphatidylcholine/phosphatidylserine synthase [Rubellimicrobium sp. CFH 75288]|uniref:CDP-alcohol phosphatidyltransferase family protein n=1 Tax=Rubellimicrobium sp. CFH 75288 TaxID=2697034 RepID=UPI001412C6CE|nr:phosphatidylcholine/phosphatidylserine synthase [Rubellimicrobium sp. CFH 75288]NAZ37471.1 CDP-diacylglycerol--serine O-phosphatidyltransferase [Rubellimicrobium sp. CFH 75288]